MWTDLCRTVTEEPQLELELAASPEIAQHEEKIRSLESKISSLESSLSLKSSELESLYSRYHNLEKTLYANPLCSLLFA